MAMDQRRVDMEQLQVDMDQLQVNMDQFKVGKKQPKEDGAEFLAGNDRRRTAVGRLPEISLKTESIPGNFGLEKIKLEKIRLEKIQLKEKQPDTISLEAELPEVLFEGMKAFIAANPRWDQYSLITSALACFLFQNGCSDKCVTQHYLDSMFRCSLNPSKF
jgi:hypothetical protein